MIARDIDKRKLEARRARAWYSSFGGEVVWRGREGGREGSGDPLAPEAVKETKRRRTEEKAGGSIPLAQGFQDPASASNSPKPEASEANATRATLSLLEEVVVEFERVPSSG